MASPLALLLLSTLVAQDGFGGAPAASPAPSTDEAAPPLEQAASEDDACRVQLASGAWVSCTDVLDNPALTSTRSGAGAFESAKRDAAARGSTDLRVPDRRPPLTVPQAPGTVRVEVEEPDFAAQVQTKTLEVTDGPYGAAFKHMAAVEEPSLLDDLRREVEILKLKEAWYREQVEARTRTVAQHEAIRLELIAKGARLTDVEVMALRLRQDCADRLGVADTLPPARVPIGIRLTLDQPVVTGLMEAGDPEGCSRDDLVTADVIGRVDELHTIEHRLATEQFGYFDTDKRRALQRRRDVLVDEVNGVVGMTAVPVVDPNQQVQVLKPVNLGDLPTATSVER